ncbi:hypothetical protein diail_340 [Diaporthe ilicicola]|nr:hypothetical protein diail_340 [Diaporthe ilicicola]
MYRLVLLALVAMLFCAMMAPSLTLLNEATYPGPAITLAGELCRRTYSSIKFDQNTILRAYAFASEQLGTFHHAVEPLITSYVSICRRIFIDLMEQFPLLRSIDQHLHVQPSYENVTFHAEIGECVLTASATGLPVDFKLHVGTVFLLLATNACSVVFSVFITTAIFTPMRIVWQITKATASLVSEPKATCGEILDKLVPASLNIAKVMVIIIAFCATALVFIVSNVAMFAANHLDFGFKLKTTSPPALSVDAAPVILKTFPDPLIAELREELRQSEERLEGANRYVREVARKHAQRRGELLRDNEILENANRCQKNELRRLKMLHWSLPQPEGEQVNEVQQNSGDGQGDLERAVEKANTREKELLQQIHERDDLVLSQKKSLEELTKERDELFATTEALRTQLAEREKVCKIHKRCDSRLRDRENDFRSQKAALEAQIEGALELKENQEATFKSKEASLRRNMAREWKKLSAACKANFERRVAAEGELKTLKMQLAADNNPMMPSTPCHAVPMQGLLHSR